MPGEEDRDIDALLLPDGWHRVLEGAGGVDANQHRLLGETWFFADADSTQHIQVRRDMVYAIRFK